jgi:dynein heavy chain
MLIETITYEGFDYTRRGTLVKHKLILAAMLCFKINVRKNLIKQVEVNALIKKSVSLEPPSQPESLRVFIPENSWAMCKGLEENVEFFKNFMNNLENETIQWKRWYGEERPEAAELPKSYKDISPFHRLFILRALRPDRLSNALSQYVSDSLGVDYIEAPAFDPFKMVSELTPKTAGFFVLFPGVDPTPDVEKVGATYGKAMADRTLVNISMGQGQEAVAGKALHEAAKKGNWIMIQNTHLMAEWMAEFELNLEIAMEEPHEDFRCFITSEPPPLPMMEICPESILQNSVKVADEAPSDLKPICVVL